MWAPYAINLLVDFKQIDDTKSFLHYNYGYLNMQQHYHNTSQNLGGWIYLFNADIWIAGF